MGDKGHHVDPNGLYKWKLIVVANNGRVDPATGEQGKVYVVKGLETMKGHLLLSKACFEAGVQNLIQHAMNPEGGKGERRRNQTVSMECMGGCIIMAIG